MPVTAETTIARHSGFPEHPVRVRHRTGYRTTKPRSREDFCRHTKKGRLRSHGSASCFALLSRVDAKAIEAAGMGSSCEADGQKATNASTETRPCSGSPLEVGP